MQKILLVEDSQDYQLLVKKTLGGIGLDLVPAMTLSDARDHVQNHDFQLIILDLMLPDGDGFELFSQLQADERTAGIPVIFLTGKEDVTTKVTAFSLGAEDYIVKPFNPLELRARVEAKLKKANRSRENLEVLNRGELVIQIPFQKVFGRQGGKEIQIDLTSREFKLLYHLARSEGQVFSREQLLTAVWGEGIHILDRTVDTHICTLRKKLGAWSQSIESVPGTGYRFISPKRPASAA